MSHSDCPQHCLDFAHRLSDAVGDVHRKYFRRSAHVEYKEDASPVTEADREAEQLARSMIMETYPEHGIRGEEYPPYQADAEYIWVIDPIDGTKLFMTGMPTFAFLLALAYRGEFILGVIDHAALGERWAGANGHGAYFNGEPARSRQCERLSDAIMCRPGYEGHASNSMGWIDAVESRVHWARWGISPYDYGLIASGCLDLAVSAGPKLHDYAALEPVVRNAGGIATDWQGNPLNMHSSNHIVVTGDRALVDQVLPLLANYAA